MDTCLSVLSGNSTLTQVLSTRYLFLLFVSHHCNTYKGKGRRPVISVDNTYTAVCGIELNRLFDRFYRADKARTYGSGFGIGLSMAKAIVQKHHGEISAANLDNRTIRFRVRL